MLTIKCAKCKSKIFKYRKIGKGRLLHCWQDRIIKDYSIRNGNQIKCECGNLIGVDRGKWVILKPNAYTRSGTYVRN